MHRQTGTSALPARRSLVAPEAAAAGASGQNEAPPLLEVRDLRVYFEGHRGLVRAVDGIDLTVRRGEVVSVVGESGCGKSATAQAIMRILRPPGRVAGGSVLLDGEDLLSVSERRMADVRGGRVAMLFQHPKATLDPTCRVGDHVAEPLRLHRGVEVVLRRVERHEVGAVLQAAPCDVGVLVAREESELPLAPDGPPLIVPFGGSEHDWAALELGAWLASATGAPLKLLGAVSPGDDAAQVSRRLADAGYGSSDCRASAYQLDNPSAPIDERQYLVRCVGIPVEVPSLDSLGHGERQQIGTIEEPVEWHRMLGDEPVRDAIRGLEAGVIDSDEYREITQAAQLGSMPTYGTGLGGPLGIQGNFFFFRERHFTDGSVAVSNRVFYAALGIIGGTYVLLVSVAVNQPDQIGVLGGQIADDSGDEDRQLPLGHIDVVERGHAAAGGDGQQDRVLAFGDVPLHQQLPAAGRGLPVDVLDVIAPDVLAQVVEVDAAADLDGGVLTLQQAAHSAMGMDREP